MNIIGQILHNLFRSVSESTGPSSAEEWAMSGHAKFAKGYDDGAIMDCTESLRINPNNNYLAYWGRGMAFFAQGKFKLAIADLTRAIEINTTIAKIYFFRGAAYGRLEEIEQGIADLRIADRLGLDDPEMREEAKQMLALYDAEQRRKLLDEC